MIKYCPHCAAELVLRQESGRGRPACPRCGYVAYRNPIPVALMLAHRGGRLALIRRGNEPLRNFWAPPAGYVEWDESAEQAAVREAREESGLTVRPLGLLGLYSRADTGILFVAYHGEIIAGEPQAGDDAADVGLFSPDDLPPQPAAHRSTLLDEAFADVLRDLFARARQLSAQPQLQETGL